MFNKIKEVLNSKKANTEVISNTKLVEFAIENLLNTNLVSEINKDFTRFSNGDTHKVTINVINELNNKVSLSFAYADNNTDIELNVACISELKTSDVTKITNYLVKVIARGIHGNNANCTYNSPLSGELRELTHKQGEEYGKLVLKQFKTGTNYR